MRIITHAVPAQYQLSFDIGPKLPPFAGLNLLTAYSSKTGLSAQFSTILNVALVSIVWISSMTKTCLIGSCRNPIVPTRAATRRHTLSKRKNRAEGPLKRVPIHRIPQTVLCTSSPTSEYSSPPAYTAVTVRVTSDKNQMLGLHICFQLRTLVEL